jgi:hypothetical protein
VSRYSDRGWSPQKHVHRAMFYAEAFRFLGHSRFYKEKHITLTGNMDDDRHLSEDYHVLKSNIITFDKDRDISNKALDAGYTAILGDVFKSLPPILQKESAVTINLDLTGTLPIYFDRLVEIRKHLYDSFVMITYNVNRTKKADLEEYCFKLDSEFDSEIILNHTKYRSMTIDSTGNVKMPVGSTMASVIYHT